MNEILYKTISYIYLLSFIAAVIIGIIFYKKREARGAIYLSLFELMISVWTLAAYFEFISKNLETKMFWGQMSYIGLTFAPLLYLAFAMDFSQYNKFLKWKYFGILMIIPALTLIIAFTNQYHHWLWPDVSIDPVYGLAVYEHGWYFWFFVSYTYVILTSGIILIFIGIYHFPSVYLVQIGLFILASLLPFSANIMYLLGINPIPGMDFTPISFMLAGIVLAFGIYRYRIFDLIPVAQQQVIHSITDGVVVLDTKNRIIMVNQAFTNTFSPENINIVGSNINDFLKDSIDCDDIFGDEHPEMHEMTFGGKVYDINCNNLYGKNRNIFGKIMVFRDISLRKFIEKSLTQTNDKLRREINEHEKLISDLESFSYSVAHDLKNPLGTLMNFTDLLEESLSTDPAKSMEFIQLMKQAGNKMLQIIDELLMLASVRSQKIKISPLPMREIIEEALRRLAGLIHQYQASVDYPSDWPEVLGYTPWMEEVWVNYISNAIKYGGRPPVIKMGYDRKNNGFVHFWIQDNGEGLSEDNMQKLFMEHERLDQLNIEGHGLGLSIVKRIVEKLGGTVDVTSENLPGKGCVFGFSLPVRR